MGGPRPARPLTRLVRGAEGFPARVEDRGRGADDVTVCGGDSSRGPCRPGATWPCPSPRPTARLPRTKRTGLPRPRRETPSHPLLSSEAPTTPSWLLTSEKEAPSAAPRNSSGAASSARPGAVPSRDSWGPAPAPRGHHPFPLRPRPPLRAWLGSHLFVFFSSLG